MGLISNFINSFKAPAYTVERLPNGRFGIFEDGTLIEGATYSRKRDAFRGGERAGIEFA